MGYLTKIKVGRGIIEEFALQYETLNGKPNHKCNASQLFFLEKDMGQNIYEYIIYYSVMEVSQ